MKSVGAAGAFSGGLPAMSESASASSHPTYSNPVLEPTATATAFIEVNGTYWAYGGEKCWGDKEYQCIPIWSSTDLVNWTFEDNVFGSRPTRVKDKDNCEDHPCSKIELDWHWTGRGIWAPEIIYHGGRDEYICYYSLSRDCEDNLNASAIGAASSPNPDGPWTDHGEVVNGDNNSIDPDVIWHNGDLYMFFGSYGAPTHVTKLTSDGLNDAWGENDWKEVARKGNPETGFEAPHVVERNGYFYLFMQNQRCCSNGSESDPPYTTCVGRATDITGPYVDKEGRDYTNPEAETELRWQDRRFKCPGHGYTIVGPDGDHWWLGEAYDSPNYNNDTIDCPATDGESALRRPMMLDKVEWEDGWPVIRGEDNTPAHSQVAPTASDTTRPDADADASPHSASVGETITFDASNSFDADSGIDSYTWFLSDGTVKHGETITHSYDSEGDYPVMLRVEDNVNLVDKDFVTIAVGEPTDSFLGNHLWKLNGNATDSVGGGDGELVGDPQWVDGVQGGGCSFDGNDDFIRCPSDLIDTSSSFSVAAWVKLDRLDNGFQTAVTQDASEVSPFYLQYSANIERFTLNMKTSNSTGAESVKAQQANRPEPGRWYHLVGVHDANAEEIRFYVDGEREAALDYTEAWDSKGYFAIGRGRWDGAPADYWDGDIDHVQTFPRPLTDAQAKYVASHVDYGKYHVEPVHASGKAVETAGGGTDDGDNVQQWEYNDFPTQKWWIESLGNGVYRLQNANSGKYLEVAGSGTSDGDNVQQWSWNDNDNQKWRLQLLDDGKYRFVNVNSGKVMEVVGGDGTNGADVQQWSWNGKDFQRFELNKL